MSFFSQLHKKTIHTSVTTAQGKTEKKPTANTRCIPKLTRYGKWRRLFCIWLVVFNYFRIWSMLWVEACYFKWQYIAECFQAIPFMYIDWKQCKFDFFDNLISIFTGFKASSFQRELSFSKKKSKIRHFLTKSYLFLRFEVWTWKSDKSYNISFSWSFFSFFLFLTHFYILKLKNILHFFAKFCVFSHFYIGFWEKKTILNVAIEFNLPLQSYEFISSTKNCLFHWRSSLNSAHSIPIHAIPFDCCCIFSLFSA